MDGEQPAGLSYGEWLKTKRRGFVESVMGKKKAALFLDGDLPIDRFINREGFELTLDELEQFNPEIWARTFG